ncbi:isochorismatase family protein [Brevibacterium otitidis]|uniref:nicotinamidase n=1 Tax=Brevibacterium otitidis TaxID=53364 RepID=A0ABV5X3K9_9MICO|nr:nicotinamidase [Brevibacterium otitidis]
MSEATTTTDLNRQSTALVLVDIQNDFCEGGALGVDGGAEVARRAAEFVAEHRGDYACVVATADWHIDPGEHFSANPDFVNSWPVHCVAGSDGAAFHPEVKPAIETVDAIFCKGEYEAAYSGFEGRRAPADSDTDGGELLAEWLRARGITAIDVCGIATDHCVRATALDGRNEGFAVRVLTDLVAGVDAARSAEALQEMDAAGAELS